MYDLIFIYIQNMRLEESDQAYSCSWWDMQSMLAGLRRATAPFQVAYRVEREGRTVQSGELRT